MWYLVAPPIIVVLSISFLLWYLSRKESDPMVAQRVLEGEKSQEISFPRTKEFFLRILEKSGQHFKVISLRWHNTLHEFTQSVKASRARVHTALEPEHDRVPTEVNQVVEAPVVEPVVDTPAEASRFIEAPIVRKARQESGTPVWGKQEETVPRPMVSEVAVHPEKKKRLAQPNAQREESLISRIARDPKDFTAYEELGDYYLERENIKDAKECYRQVLKLSPVHRMVKIKIRRLEKLLTKAGE